LNIDDARDIIEALINEPVDPKLPAFGTYDEAKVRIELEIKLPQEISKGKRKVEKLKTDTGPLMLIEGKGEDAEGEESEKEEETEKEAKPTKKKGKVIITKPLAVFTSRTRKGRQESEVVFNKSPPTFEERLKQLRVGAGISNFKALKYETRTPAEQKEIEDLVMEKLGTWKCSPDQFASQIPTILFDKIKVRWEHTEQTVRDILAQRLRELVLDLTDAEINKALKDHKGSLNMRFNTCLILLKSIEPVVKNSTDVWSDVYKLHKPTEEIVEIKDDDNNSDEEEMDGGNTISMDITDEDLEQLAREKEEEEKEEEVEEEVEEEDDPEKIAAAVIASLPHSPPKTAKSTMETGSSSNIVSTTEISIAQYSPATSQLQVSTSQVPSTSSTELQVTSSFTEP
jgi:hypothetical protein